MSAVKEIGVNNRTEILKPFQTIPKEIWIAIFILSGIKAIPYIALSCKHWSVLVKEPALWKHFAKQHIPKAIDNWQIALKHFKLSIKNFEQGCICYRTFRNHKCPRAWCLDVNTDFFCIGGSNGIISVYNRNDPSIFISLQGHDARSVSQLALIDKHMVSSCYDETIRIWDLDSKTTTHVINKIAPAIILFKDSDCLCSISSEGEFHSFKWNTWEKTKTTSLTKDPSDNIQCTYYSDKTLFIGSGNKQRKDYHVYLYKLPELNLVGEIPLCNYRMRCITLTKDHLIIGVTENTGKPNGQIALVNISDKKIIDLLHGHRYMVTSLLLYHDVYLLSGSDEGEIRLWDLEKRTCLSSFKEHCQTIVSMNYQDGQLFTVSMEGALKQWHLVPSEKHEPFIAIARHFRDGKPTQALEKFSTLTLKQQEAVFGTFYHIKGTKFWNEIQDNTWRCGELAFLKKSKTGELISDDDRAKALLEYAGSL